MVLYPQTNQATERRASALRFAGYLMVVVAIGCSSDGPASRGSQPLSGADAGFADAISTSCMQHNDAAGSLVAAATMGDDLTCASDSDCLFAANSTSCSSGCGVLVNRAGAIALAAAIDRAESAICDLDRSCIALAIPCPAPTGLGLASCIAGTCQSVPPAGWDSFAILQQAGQPGTFSTPPRCDPNADCTLWTVTPDANVTVTKHGQTRTQQLSAADFSTVDGILRSMPLRDPFFLSTMPNCDPAPTEQEVSIALTRSGPTVGRDVTGCVLAGPPGNVWLQLYDALRSY
jgi:hypothetical protein